jgi:hypothetical protein
LFIVRIVMPILEKSDIGKLLSEQDAARSVGSRCYEIFVYDDAVRLDEKADARHNDLPVIQSACENDNSNSVRCSHFTSCHC